MKSSFRKNHENLVCQWQWPWKWTTLGYSKQHFFTHGEYTPPNPIFTCSFVAVGFAVAVFAIGFITDMLEGVCVSNWLWT